MIIKAQWFHGTNNDINAVNLWCSHSGVVQSSSDCPPKRHRSAVLLLLKDDSHSSLAALSGLVAFHPHWLHSNWPSPIAQASPIPSRTAQLAGPHKPSIIRLGSRPLQILAWEVKHFQLFRVRFCRNQWLAWPAMGTPPHSTIPAMEGRWHPNLLTCFCIAVHPGHSAKFGKSECGWIWMDMLI